MGQRGPAPKRSDQRRRTNDPPQEITRAPGAAVVDVPAPEEGWHPLARAWFESLAGSGQSAFYEPSDWATAALIAEAISRELQPKPIITMIGPVKDENGDILLVDEPPKAASVAAWLKGMTALMVTEGDRRRASLELQRPDLGGEDGGDADVSHLDDARNRLRGAQ